MADFHNDSISATYHHGSKIILTPDWKDKNVICPNSKIYYVKDGEICVEVKNRVLIAKRGDVILIPAGTKHSYHLTDMGHAEKYWFHFDLRIGQANYFDTIALPYIKHLGEEERLDALFETVVNTKAASPSESLLVSSSIMLIMSIYLEGINYIDSPNEDFDETDKVITYIKKNYFEKFTLNRLSDIAKLTPNYFTKKFKEKVGHPPLKYINILRIERAKFLLEHTEKPINTVMEEVGFWDSAHFSKLFRTETGYSPSKFRKALASRDYSHKS